MVKFSHSLQFNTVPDWANEYIAYSNLKKTLYAIEKYNVQNSIEGGTPRPSDVERGYGGNISSALESEKSPTKLGKFLGLKGRGERDAVVAAAVQEAASLHNGSDIFPPESAAFERGVAKELAKITSFYIRKERELSAELEAVDRQWQLEEMKKKKERIARGEEDSEKGSGQGSEEIERRMSVNIDDEMQLKDVEKSQLKDMMGWDKDGLVDQGTVIDMRSADSLSNPPAFTVNGSTVADVNDKGDGRQYTASVPGTAMALSDVDGSEYNPKSYGHQSSVGDLTEIVWRRECLIESDNEETKEKKQTAKKKRESRQSGQSLHSLDGPYMAQSSADSNKQDGATHSNTRHHSLDNLGHPETEATDLKRSRSQNQRKHSLNPRRSVSAIRGYVTGANVGYENPNMRPSVYAPLTTEALLRRRLIDTYMQLSELKSYVALNYLGFQKIVKKHDKLARCTTLARYMASVVNLSAPFQAESRQQLNDQILRLQAIYARTCTDGSMAQAAKELRSHLREYIVWERNTIWRDMVGQERKAEGARAVDPKEQEPWMLFGYPIRFISAADARRIILGLVGIVLFAILMSVSIFDTQEQNRCFAILISVAYFWATEVFPLFATSLLVPLMTVLCQVIRDPVTKATLSTSDATKIVFSSMFSPTIMLLLGGFTIASALSKYGIAKSIASTVLSKAGTDPKWVLLANMFVATVASMFISNVAAPVLCFSLVQSILRTLPHKSTFAPCLIMGIALASNVGGMASPISSPQNIITIQNMDPAPSWGNWFAVAIPLCIVIDLVIWAWLMLLWRPQRDTPTIPSIRATKEPITFQKVFICLVTIGTIVLWCVENTFKEQLGDMGVIAILPLVAFFGTGLLTKDDFNNFLWTVIMLAMGGISLGKAVDSSGLLDTIAHYIQDAVAGLSLWVVLLIFSALTLVFATFVSHTVAAVIILPIVQQVGLSFADPHPRILVMGTGLICSAAMGLPVSGFPNMNAIALEDEMGVPYLKTIDFVKSGVPLSIIATLCVVTIGYGIMSALGY
ncbi:low-affinity phosphate transporter [Mortierella polycephala]|uniref:Low-affinity phosphate transporter n=1 Tax=Mortierella polycephala TaxID=41804 RepID=A0A9P6U1N5_9FUNG|nr:low-affinity phosphate transporter [Mortierella polycephala]